MINICNTAAEHYKYLLMELHHRYIMCTAEDTKLRIDRAINCLNLMDFDYYRAEDSETVFNRIDLIYDMVKNSKNCEDSLVGWLAEYLLFCQRSKIEIKDLWSFEDIFYKKVVDRCVEHSVDISEYLKYHSNGCMLDAWRRYE